MEKGLDSKFEKPDFSLILASSVHDMKNSVGMLLGSLEEFISEGDPQSVDQEKRVASLQYEASRINVELIQLLSVYRMQDDRLPIHIEEQFLFDIFEDQVARNDMLFKTRNIKATISCERDLKWYFDGELIGGVIHNVLVNCIRYAKAQVELTATLEDSGFCIQILDDGEGYPDEMLEQPVSADNQIDFKSGSTHLGLYFASKVAGLHTKKDRAGRIRVQNGGSLGGGIFKLYLP